MNKKQLTQKIKNYSLDTGFDLFGITNPTKQLKNFKYLDNWLESGYDASMKWIANRQEERKNIYKYFPEVKSIISLGINYYSKRTNINESKYKISSYAWGEDYHILIKEKLYSIIDFIKQYDANFKYRVCVDTSPIMEKAWAQEAGLGWIGKHTNLINKKIGSWFFLSEILLDFELEYSNKFEEDLCGTCTKCIDECPTDAIEPYNLNSNKCISYLTIEHRDDIDVAYDDKLDNWIYGCDICQDVCPWNIKFSEISSEKGFHIREKIETMLKDDWDNLSESKYKELFKKSAVKRTKYKGLKRNIKLNKN